MDRAVQCVPYTLQRWHPQGSFVCVDTLNEYAPISENLRQRDDPRYDPDRQVPKTI
jgi:hypothetical protein